MEKKEPTTSNRKGACEKLFDALSVTPSFRPFRRISYQSQDHVPAPASAAPNLPATSLPPSSVAQNKKPSHAHPEPVKTSQHMGMPGKTKVAEVVPTKAGPLPSPPPPSTTNQKEKPNVQIVPAQGKSHIEKVGHKIDLATKPASDQQVTGQPKGKVDANTLIKTVVQQGKEIAGKVDTKIKEKIAAGKVEEPEVAPTKGENGRKGALASINEKANDYVARAKYKIRPTTTPSGGGDGGRTI
ncbi:hypothetical protein FRX31_013772 [Thalictrum thalictroides]|uniref:Uncharacterized protein n=1 Tax=Thalictrum thalictroides TaxID=46969 RepID=A0A7J6WJ23_THATH|nr:hypothetical protein FRX31_013772 [Thalictrum thalictroides]